MKLNRVEIKNFRSIKEQTITFEHNFQTLVGINESGKSNVIKALSLLDEDSATSKDDVRDPGHDEDAVSTSYVRFVFKVYDRVINAVYENLLEKTIAKSIDSAILNIGSKIYSLLEFCEYKNEFLYIVNVIKDTRNLSHWKFSGPRFRVHNDWKKINAPTPGETIVELDGKDVDLHDFLFVNVKDYPAIPSEYLEEITIIDLNSAIGSELLEQVEGHLPSTIFWKYSEENILPGRINFSQFVTDPSTCIPLKNMFSLAGYHNPTKALKEAEGKTNGVKNILRKVSKNTTQHMQKVWPEWKKQKVLIAENGEFIEAGIEDEYNVYSLSRRSDGFKRFFTFLLMVSVQNKTENIYHNLILIDEPDIGLHPSGVQYLREELIKISTNNLLVISTHSIFMIDKNIIDRHRIVEKDKEVTLLTQVGPSNIVDEEIIYKALGYSLFELLKPYNIIFEGWRDKYMFSLFSRSVPGKRALDKSQLSNTGLLHSMGVKDVGRVANTCENFSRKYIIITDSDNPAKEKKRQFVGEGEWHCCDEFDGVDAVTSEDFVSNKAINSAISFVLKENNIKNKIEIPDTITKDKVAFIKRKVSQFLSEKEEINSLVNSIKGKICERIKAADLDGAYSSVFQELMRKLHA